MPVEDDSASKLSSLRRKTPRSSQKKGEEDAVGIFAMPKLKREVQISERKRDANEDGLKLPETDASPRTSENVIVEKTLFPGKKRCADRGMCGAGQHSVMRSVLLQSADRGKEVAG